jgi:hypothetical protein
MLLEVPRGQREPHVTVRLRAWSANIPDSVTHDVSENRSNGRKWRPSHRIACNYAPGRAKKWSHGESNRTQDLTESTRDSERLPGESETSDADRVPEKSRDDPSADGKTGSGPVGSGEDDDGGKR